MVPVIDPEWLLFFRNIVAMNHNKSLGIPSGGE